MLRIENIYTKVNHTFSLNDISLYVEPGEIFLIVGKNGSGKSTLFKSIIGLLPHQSGNIYFKNKLINRLSPDKRIRLGISFVFQERRLYLSKTVYENLKCAYFLNGRFSDVIEEIYDILPLLKLKRNTLAGNLSGGEQEILALARAFIQNPQLILLDEPFSGLANDNIEIVLNLFKNFINQNNSLIISEHKIDFFNEFKTKSIMLKNGRIC